MAQETDSQLQTRRAVIENETTANANTTTRVGDMFENLIDSKINVDKIVDEDTMVSDSNTLVPTQQSVKAYVDANVGGGSILTSSISDGDTTHAPDGNSVFDALALKFTTASASESAQGIAELSTQSENNTGTDDARIVTTLKLKNLDRDVTTLTDAGTIDLAQPKNTLASSASSRTFTISHTGEYIVIEVTLSTTTATYTFPATALCTSEGSASGNNTLALSGVSGDKYIIVSQKIGSNYYIVSKNFGQ